MTREMWLQLGIPLEDAAATRKALAVILAPIIVEHGWDPESQVSWERATKIAYYRSLRVAKR